MSNLTLQFIANTIHKDYHVSQSEAEDIVANSFVAELYDECWDFIEHYSIKYWADEIMSSYNVNA